MAMNQNFSNMHENAERDRKRKQLEAKDKKREQAKQKE